MSNLVEEIKLLSIYRFLHIYFVEVAHLWQPSSADQSSYTEQTVFNILL